MPKQQRQEEEQIAEDEETTENSTSSSESEEVSEQDEPKEMDEGTFDEIMTMANSIIKKNHAPVKQPKKAGKKTTKQNNETFIEFLKKKIYALDRRYQKEKTPTKKTEILEEATEYLDELLSLKVIGTDEKKQIIENIKNPPPDE